MAESVRNSDRISDLTHTSWWAAAALLQNARVTTKDLSAPEASLGTSSDAESSVMASSSGVNHPEVAGHPVTSS